MVAHKSIVTLLAEVINKSQYYNPFFSWICVVFTYFSLSIQGGKVWKHLLFSVTFGFLASFCSITSTISKGLDYYHFDFFSKLTWVEGYLWTLSECGYVYINYMKIKPFIKKLRKKHWKYIMGGILIYSIIVRTILIYLDYCKKIDEWKKNDKSDHYDQQKKIYHSLLYLPFGIVCILIAIYTLNEYLKGNNGTKQLHTVLLQSSLFRTFFVSILFIGISVIVVFPSVRLVSLIKETLWRMKGNLGLIFLLDLLLLRIDLDSNQIAIKKQEIEKDIEQQTLSEISTFSQDSKSNNFYSESSPIEFDEYPEKVYSKQHTFPYNINSIERVNSINNIYTIQENEVSENLVNHQLSNDINYKPKDKVHFSLPVEVSPSLNGSNNSCQCILNKNEKSPEDKTVKSNPESEKLSDT